LNFKGEHWPGYAEVATADWIQRHIVQNQFLVYTLRRDLDREESESIALALELGADMLLLDEREGRHAAQRLGVKVVGVVGVLLEAKSHGVIPSLRPHLDALRQNAGFYLKESLYQSVLVLANEPIA